ncbi:MAG: type II toxin-antitoxin system prevent-host-death family antitoxin [Sulfuricellaceae bacterium]|nr:type II toxin-antitoxin system prevent-host-death family antitoxin [Sulfuricellaceae bacterium]
MRNAQAYCRAVACPEPIFPVYNGGLQSTNNVPADQENEIPTLQQYYNEYHSNKISTGMNTLTVSELKRRGMAAIEDGLRHGPLHIVKRNKPAAVVLTVAEYQKLSQGRGPTASGVTAVQWLLNQPANGKRSKAQIDTALEAERDW